MPRIDRAAYDAAEATTNEEYKRMPAGGYVVRIQAVRTKDAARGIDYIADKQYVKLIWDVDEGEFAGKFSDDYFAGEDKDYAHQLYFSWKNMGAFKSNVWCFEDSNPGFDALAAVDYDRWELFVGKRVGLVLGEEEYMGSDGTVKTRFGFPRVKSVKDIHDGKFKVPPLKKLEGAPSQAPTDTYDDVPF